MDCTPPPQPQSKAMVESVGSKHHHTLDHMDLKTIESSTRMKTILRKDPPRVFLGDAPKEHKDTHRWPSRTNYTAHGRSNRLHKRFEGVKGCKAWCCKGGEWKEGDILPPTRESAPCIAARERRWSTRTTGYATGQAGKELRGWLRRR